MPALKLAVKLGSAADYRARAIKFIRQQHKTGELKKAQTFIHRWNRKAKETGLTEAGFYGLGAPIDVRKCIDDPNYK